MHFDPAIAYNQLPPLPPACEVESKVVLQSCIHAARALGELKQATRIVPNPRMLMQVLPLREAQDSSAIENVVTTQDKLFQAMAQNERGVDSDTKEVLRYREALTVGLKRIGSNPIDTPLMLELVSTLMNEQVAIRDRVGVYIGSRATRKPVYTPPKGESLIRQQLLNLAQYLNDEKGPDPIIRMAVAHYQFEAIHPFHDGNGRTGRLLNLLYLIRSGLLEWPVLYPSQYIHKYRTEYYEALLNVTVSAAWEPWLLFMLDAVRDSARQALQRINEIHELRIDTAGYIKNNAPKVYSHELLDILFTQPYCRIRDLVDTGLVLRQAAASHLRELVKIGLLKEEKRGRDVLFLHAKLLSILSK